MIDALLKEFESKEIQEYIRNGIEEHRKGTLKVQVVSGGKKVAGILCEGIFSEDGTSLLGAVCGVGINVYKRVFPPEISSIATTLEDTAPVNISREELISKIIEEFFSPDFNILDEYRRRSLVLGKEVRVISAVGEYDAQAISITDKGHLVVKLSDGSEKELSSGEVSIKPKIN